jgi:meso-butanediol dehydrogenase / (S,S)-butanediol dehydrogenase / diacetyl reductase
MKLLYGAAMRLKGKIAIITGAKSGIGFATVARFASEGAKVILADLRDSQREAEIIAKNGGEAIFFQVDVSNEKEVEALIQKTIAAYSHLDLLVNNAGIELAKKITETTEAEWDHLMNVNLKGVFLCSKAAIPAMRNNGGGIIVNVASELGLVGGSEIAAYCASKGGVVQLTKAMAIDHVADNIRVNCVCPGPVATSLLESIIATSPDPEKERQSIVTKTLMKRLAQPEEIANAILFLSSEESSYMTGSVVAVDGGWTAQ